MPTATLVRDKLIEFWEYSVKHLVDCCYSI